ncbi:hypothetical protein [Aquimarina algiphila]|uniref:hypothetical protein n=1 Tax=Aquimarina algiphila TaxID=2047982 RepID=UPI00232CD55B|nr:hypothetical protein [Aquimarina algiphila]
MSKELRMNKTEILSQLKKEGVTDLNEFADMLVKKCHKNGDENEPIIMAAIVYGHGFISH